MLQQAISQTSCERTRKYLARGTNSRRAVNLLYTIPHWSKIREICRNMNKFAIRFLTDSRTLQPARRADRQCTSIVRKHRVQTVWQENHSLSVTKWLCSLPGIVFLCFFGHYTPLKTGKNTCINISKVFRHKKTSGAFDESSNFNIRYTLSLGGISCISAGLFVYDFSLKPTHFFPNGFTLCHSIYLHILRTIDRDRKSPLYQFINWIFFDKKNKAGFLPILICSPISLCLISFITARRLFQFRLSLF